MSLSHFGEKRHGKRLGINCPATLRIAARGKPPELLNGRLLDVGIGGARLQVARRLETGARIILEAHFRGAKQRVTTVRFEGVVRRVQEQPAYEVAVQFRRAGRILREEAAGLFADSQAT